MAGKKTEDCKTARDERTKEHKPLTPKMKHFCRCVAGGMTQAAAYREAYDVNPDSKKDSAQQAASRLMSDLRVRSRVDQLIAEKDRALSRNAVSDREKVRAKLTDWMENAKDVTANQVRAAELLGRSVGMFKDVVETTDKRRSSDELKDELQRRLDSLLVADQDEEKQDGDTVH